jgi:GT2 family glycosyltransferase
LSVVIVNYCQWENTAALVRQLRRSEAVRRGTAEIVVVDNRSPRHRLTGKLRCWQGVSLRRWDRNRGFGRAVNEGCRLSQGEWFLLLNPDMSVRPEFIEGVLKVMDEVSEPEPRAGVVGFQLRNGDGTRQLSSGRFPTLTGTLAGLAWPRCRRKYQAVRGKRRCRVPWVTGCCLLVRRDCWRELGGFAEDYFLYYEDVDLCRRARAADWTVWYEPSLRAVHHNPIHARSMPAALRLVTRHSLLTYARRHWTGWQFRLLTGIVRLEAWTRRLWARWHGDTVTANLYDEMSVLAGELSRGDKRDARRRLERVVQEHSQMLVSNVRTPEARREDGVRDTVREKVREPAERV